jgi:hypothetical protein
MALNLDLGSVGTVALDADGDLGKRLRPGLDTLVKFNPQTLNFLGTKVADLPTGSLSSDFNFDVGPSWQVSQQVGITLSIEPEVGCSLEVISPGGELFRFTADEDETPVTAAPVQYYLKIGLLCGLTIDAGVQWSSGQFGVSGDISKGARFRVANFCPVPATATLREALQQAFSAFVLPFQADRAAAMADGTYVDFEFVGKLGLGFGATYGFSGLFLAGRSNGEVSASFQSPVGQAVASVAPSYQVGAAFKLQYEEEGAFRVITGRTKNATQNGASIYLFRKDATGLTTSETLGITFSPGAKFSTDASTLKNEIQQAVARAMPGKAGATWGSRLADASDALINEVNNGASALLGLGDGHGLQLALEQSEARESSVLFLYDFDFNQSGLAAYDMAMRCDYATAITLPGASLDPRSFVERLYVKRTGLDVQLFDALKFHSITDYIDRTDVNYVGGRTFQIRDSIGVKDVSGLFGKERRADLYFIAQRKSGDSASDPHVKLQAMFQEHDNADASSETERMLVAFGQPAAKPAKVTLEADAARFGSLPAGGAVAYNAFVRAVSDVIGPQNNVVDIFLAKFGRYDDWKAFSDAVDGNANGDRWPDGYPPSDRIERLKVQTYILGGQHFMDFCDGLKHLAGDAANADTDAKYAALLDAIRGMVHNDLPFPTYFLKPGMVAVMRLAGVTPAVLLPSKE